MSDLHIHNLREASSYFRQQAEPDTAYERDADSIDWILNEVDRLRHALKLIAIADQGCGGTLRPEEIARSAMQQARDALNATHLKEADREA